MPLTSPLKVLIVGCGRIAGGFDRGSLEAGASYSHAGAYCKSDKFELSACVDPDDQVREQFMNKWGILEGYRTLNEAKNSKKYFDVISICTPTPFHEDSIAVAVDFAPKLIFCEKPLGLAYDSAKNIVEICSRSGIRLAVNFSRRWDLTIKNLKIEIENEKWGKLRAISGSYCKGLINNGAHMIDLLGYLVGKLDVEYVGAGINDFSQNDLSRPFVLKAGSTPIFINCVNGSDYSMFETQFFFSKATIEMKDGGLRWLYRYVEDDPIFTGYRKIALGELRQGHYSSAFDLAVENIYCNIHADELLASDGISALTTQSICDQILNFNNGLGIR
jgi:predicted dehydrogenase